MWKSIVYKEWLKIRWFLLVYTFLGILCIGYLFLALKHSFAFTGGKMIWYMTLFQGHQFYNIFKYVPLAGGLTVAIAQYLPEAANKRLRLTFHLPLYENNVLMIMLAFGAGCLLATFLILGGLLAGTGSLYFPIQMIVDLVEMIAPWLLAGCAVYFIAAQIIVEPKPLCRLGYSLIGGFFLSIYFSSGSAGSYAYFYIELLVVTVSLSLTIMFSAYKFRKGEM